MHAITIGPIREFLQNIPLRQGLILTDKNVLKNIDQDLCQRLFSSYHVMTLPSSERAKTLNIVKKIWHFLQQNGFERKSGIIALGGGAISDVAGFAASSYLRGLDFYIVPTTLLAMVDASIGGKTGINFAKEKNRIGSFWPAKGVGIDYSFLSSLPPKQMRSGMAEVVKAAVIQGGDFFALLEAKGRGALSIKDDDFQYLMKQAIALKCEIVDSDPYEKSGRRVLLNLGHTFGHALESLNGFCRITHGQAVAAGISLAASVSYVMGLCPLQDVERIDFLLKNLGLGYKLPPDFAESAAPLMLRDKKSEGGKLSLVLLRSIGDVFLSHETPMVCVKEAVRLKNSRNNK